MARVRRGKHFFSVGALSIGKYFALGDNARAMIALGDTEATGSVFQKIGERSTRNITAVKQSLDIVVPTYLSWAKEITKLFLYPPLEMIAEGQREHCLYVQSNIVTVPSQYDLVGQTGRKLRYLYSSGGGTVQYRRSCQHTDWHIHMLQKKDRPAAKAILSQACPLVL